MGIETWSPIAGNNTNSPPNGAPEGMNPGSVNDCIRQVMGDVRAWYNTPQWRNLGDTPTYVSATSFTLVGDVTGSYVVGQRVRLTDATTLYGTIATSVYSAPNTTITVTLDSGSLSNSLSVVSVGVEPTGTPIAFNSVAGLAAATGSNVAITGGTISGVTITGGSISGITDLAIADGGTGASTAADAFTNLKQVATTSATGVVELATSAEMSSFTGGVVPTADIMPCAKVSTTVISSGSATSGTIALPSGMSRYEIYYENLVPATASVTPVMDVSVDSGSTWLTGYYTQRFAIATTSSQTSDDASTAIALSNNPVVSDAGFPCWGRVTLMVSTSIKNAIVDGYYRIAGLNVNYSARAVPQTSNTINAIRFRFSSGNITSGTITVWAWK